MENKLANTEKMKAIVYTEYGSPEVLKIREIEKPLPKENEVLVKVYAASVNYGDVIARNFRNISPKGFNMPLLFWVLARLVFGINKPKVKILGSTFAGEIESVGKNVSQFSKGGRVFGYTGQSMGTYAEYLCIPEKGILAEKPTHMTYNEASVVPYGSIMAYCLLKKLNIQNNQKILIVGASGAIGSAAVQLAKKFFGAEVTGVCGTQRVDFVKKLGADKVIDYEKEKITNTGETYDFIFDVLGIGRFSFYKKLLNKNGICLYASFKAKKLLQMTWTSVTSQKKVVCAIAVPTINDLNFIKGLADEGKIVSIIDKRFSPEQAAEAHKYYESRMKQGDVVIQISQ